METIETFTNQELVDELMKRHTFGGAILYNQNERRNGVKPSWHLKGSPGFQLEYVRNILDTTIKYIDKINFK